MAQSTRRRRHTRNPLGKTTYLWTRLSLGLETTSNDGSLKCEGVNLREHPPIAQPILQQHALFHSLTTDTRMLTTPPTEGRSTSPVLRTSRTGPPAS